MPRRTIEVEAPDEGWFSDLLEARQRIRTLVVHVDPEQANWSTGNHTTGFPARPEKPDRVLALALMGIHDQIQVSISGYIEELKDREAADEPEEEVRAP